MLKTLGTPEREEEEGEEEEGEEEGAQVLPQGGASKLEQSPDTST